MESIAQQLIAAHPDTPPLLIYAGLQVAVAAALLLIFVAPFAGILSFVERRIAGRMMSRIGPNRVGPQGILQWLADGIKALLKEDLIPAGADVPLFKMAPYLVFVGMFATFVTIPFGNRLIVADLNVGVFYIAAIASLVVIGILMAGWGSNNKYSLLGGMRSAAQIISYEVPGALGILVPVLLAGSLSLQEIIRAQGAWPHQWFLFQSPFAAIGFVVLFTSLLAENNRTPFDIPEAESELVAGYNTEYSGMRFLFFFFEEWATIYVVAALGTALYLGGWQIPAGVRDALGWSGGIMPYVAEFLTFFVKALCLVFVVVWLRWTLPRVRIDQLMITCWKYLTPIGFACVVATALWMVLFPKGLPAVSWILVALAVCVLGYFVKRVVFHLRWTRSRLTFNPLS